MSGLKQRPIILTILDGWGLGPEDNTNAIYVANTPTWDMFTKKYPMTQLKASGLAVGLPEGQMGNSEVGHLNIGAGRVVYQPLVKITLDIKEGRFFKNAVLLDAVNFVKKTGGKLHLIGLLSDGGVHSHIEHLKGLIKLAKINGVKDVFIHALLDGRDVPPRCAEKYVKEIEEYMNSEGLGAIASIQGRYYGMDRDKRWERTKLGYDAIKYGEGLTATDALSALFSGYERSEDDEFLKPTVILGADGKPIATVEEGDAIIFFNFRPDRARQLTAAFTQKDFDYFERYEFKKLKYVCMTEYDSTFNLPVAYPPEDIRNGFGEYISKLGYTQLRIAETEKYAHVTYFFSGGREEPYDGEDRVLIPSPKVPTYDMKPEMSAFEVADEVIKRIKSGKYDVIILNFANGDMVGHTGIFKAAIKAIEAVDSCLKRIYDVIKEVNGIMLVTADHGNADWMLDEKGNRVTAHSLNPVPFILINYEKNVQLQPGILADITPTMLDLMGLNKPEEMTGKSLIKR